MKSPLPGAEYLFFMNDPQYGRKQWSGSYEQVGVAVYSEIKLGRLKYKKDGTEFTIEDIVSILGLLIQLPIGCYMDVQNGQIHLSRDTEETHWYVARQA